ncbi:hypothetical protein BYT27DRAFT_7038510, partial [Phlegmacium glaucopus]
PDGGRKPSPRPPSPLRNGYIMDSSTGIEPDNGSEDGSDDEVDDPATWQRSPSPASSVSHLAASFVQRVNAFVGGIAPRSPGGSLTDAELEAEAERERDRSRREAEAILTKEAQQRKLVEERVLAMVETTKSLPPPPSRPQTLSNPPSPSSSQKESSWWSAAKSKLTPSKEALTPAQQVIIDAKAREKEKKGGKAKEKEWPSNAQGKFSDPAFTNLNIPVAPPQRRPVPSSPSSPTPSRPSLTNMAPNLTPSPMRTIDSISSSPSREAPPIYVQFNAQGTLDVPGTLLAIAKRFEKLEKWTVGHVRALEDRMNDVERWLVDKEKEKEVASLKEETKEIPLQELQEIREEVLELQGRVGELGREMAKLATIPSNLSSAPKSQVTSVSIGPQTISSVIVQQNTGPVSPSTPHHRRLSSTTARESTSPPMASTKTPSGTRLPYPQGDYTSPPNTFSPTNSPPGSINAAVRTRPIPISGLPSTGLPSAGLPSSTSTSYSSTSYSSTSSISSFGGRPLSNPHTVNISPTVTGTSSATGLPPPNSTTQRQTSISPTPRKRYTVALGGPIVAPDELSSNAAEPPRVGTPKSFSKPQSSIDSAFFSSTTSGSRRDMDGDNQTEDIDLGGEETIGKSTAARLMNSGMGDYKVANPSSPPMSNRRLRAQSAYGFSNIPGSNTMASGGNVIGGLGGVPSVAPLKPKLRSKSSERLNTGGGTGDGMVSAVAGTKFIDPLILRKQSRDSFKVIAMPKPIGKVPIGQLVAFFDGDK